MVRRARRLTVIALRFVLALLVYPGFIFTVGLGFAADRVGRALRPAARRPAAAIRARGPVDLRADLLLAVVCFVVAAALLPLPGSLIPSAYANLGGILALGLLGLWLRGLAGAGAAGAAIAWALTLTALCVAAGTLDVTGLRGLGGPAQSTLRLAGAVVALLSTALLLAAEPTLRTRRRSLDLSGAVDQLHAGAGWAAWAALALIFTNVFVPPLRPPVLGTALALVAFVAIGALSAAARRIDGRTRRRIAQAVLLPASVVVVLVAGLLR
jgi:hypothetical protein